eukprot:8702028-Ditylum_brightwellii.AAC.1
MVAVAVAVAVGQLCPAGACKGTRELIVVFFLLFLANWVILGDLGVSVGIASSVFGLTWLAAHNADSNDNDNDA